MFLILLFAISCNPNTPEKNPNIPDANESITIYKPRFYQSNVTTNQANEIQSRGIIDMIPDGSPFQDSITSQAVLSSFPFMTSLKKEEFKRSEFDEFKNLEEQKIYGFNIIPRDGEGQVLNNDGYYVRYEIASEGKYIGFIEYYFNIDTNCFSYRQIVLLNIPINQNPLRFNNAILSIEYKDIKVNEDGSFQIGALDSNGELKQNGIVDFYYLDSTMYSDLTNLPPVKAETLLWRKYVTAQMKDGIYAVFFQPEKIVTHTFESDEVKKAINSISGENNKNDIIDTQQEAKNAGLDVVNGILPKIYRNYYKILDHDPGYNKYKGKYTSYEEFLNSSLFEFSGMIIDDDKIDENSYRFIGINQPVIMDINNPEKTAFIRMSDIETGTFKDFDITRDGDVFKTFYGDLKSPEEFTKAHLKACGITNDDFIENYISANVPNTN